MKKASGFIFTPEGEFRYGTVTVNEGLITEIEYTDESDGGCEEQLMILPGLVDIHIHGAAGADFSDGTYEAIDKIAIYEKQHGIAAFLITTMTLPKNELLDIAVISGKYIEDYLKEKDLSKACPAGIYVEGPFVSASKKGAQKEEYISLPDSALLQEMHKKSGNNVKFVLLAPELENSREFILKMREMGIRCTTGHTDADYNTAKEAIEMGVIHATHLFNGMSSFNHRNPGASGAYLMNDKAEVELIADGNHLHPDLLKFVFTAKNKDKVILISDSMRATGMSDGEYTLGGQPVIKKGNRATLPSGTLAGSVSNLYDCMVNAINSGVDSASAILAATINPAKSIGIDKDFGTIEVGKRSSLLLVDDNWKLKRILE